MYNDHKLETIAKKVGRDANSLNSRERRYLQRVAHGRCHNWVRTPAKVWKVFGRDENHKWRRWCGSRYWPSGGDGGWEYASDRAMAHGHIRYEFCPPITSEH